MSRRNSRTIYVGNLPGDIREREVEDLFYKVGVIFLHTPLSDFHFCKQVLDWSGQMSNYGSVNKIFCLSSFSILLMWEYLFGVNVLHFLLWHLIVYYLQLGLGIARELLLDFNRSFLLSCVNQRNILYVFFVWSKQCSLLFLKLCTYFIMSLHDLCF